MTRKHIAHFYELALATIVTAATFCACQNEQSKISDKKNQYFLINQQSIIKPLNNDSNVTVKNFTTSAKEWDAVKNELLEHHKHGYFAPAINDSIDMSTSNCYNAAIGVDVIKSSCVYPGIIGRVEDTTIEKLPWDWHLKYAEMKDLAIALKQDNIIKEIPLGGENDRFPVIAFVCKGKKSNFHFVRPFLKGPDNHISFSEKQSCVYPLRQFDDFDALKKEYHDNQQYIHPTVFYVPKNYLQAKLVLNNTE